MKTKTALLVVSLVMATSVFAGSSGPASQATRYMVVVTGGELLAGAYADGHTHFLTRTLRPLGLQCVGSMGVDDKQADLMAALRFATGRADLVLVTGGLGPTTNDITREALSEFTGVELKEHPDVLGAMAQRFGVRADQLGDNLRRQTQVPVGGTYLKNGNGTAVGLVFETKERVIVALPGPPRELQAMVYKGLVPYLNRRFGTRLPGCSVTLRFVGLGQSQIDHKLKDNVHMPPDIIVNSQFKGGRVDFTFSLPDDTPKNRARLEQLKKAILNCLGENIYGTGETTLEEHVVALLKARRETLALVEIGSGGALVAALHGAVDADQVLAGAYVAPTEAMVRRLLAGGDNVSADGPTGVTQLVRATAQATGSPWAIAVGPVQQNESEGRYVEVALRHQGGDVVCWRAPLHGSSEMAQWSLTTRLLDRLRRTLQ